MNMVGTYNAPDGKKYIRVHDGPSGGCAKCAFVGDWEACKASPECFTRLTNWHYEEQPCTVA